MKRYPVEMNWTEKLLVPNEYLLFLHFLLKNQQSVHGEFKGPSWGVEPFKRKEIIFWIFEFVRPLQRKTWLKFYSHYTGGLIHLPYLLSTSVSLAEIKDYMTALGLNQAYTSLKLRNKYNIVLICSFRSITGTLFSVLWNFL